MSDIPAFGPWSEQTHTDDKQKKALARAQLSETTPLTVDRTAETAVFYGRGKDPYSTSLSSCSCNDFVKRKLPCKHIYRLAMELGIIKQSYKTGMSKGERLDSQLSFEDSVAVLETLSQESQLAVMEMLGLTSDRLDSRHTPYLIENAAILPDLRSCPLLEERPATEMILSRMKRAALNDLIARSGVENPPKKSSASAVLSDWILHNIPNPSDLLPPWGAFSFIVGFDKAQRSAYQYLLRKYTDDCAYLTDEITVSVPHGARLPDLSIFILVEGMSTSPHRNPNAFYFPDDAITAMLTKYGCNRCLNGFIPGKQSP